MKKQCNVVMLSTEKATGLFIQTMNIWGDPVYAKRKLEYTTNETLIRNNHLVSNRKAATNALDKYDFNHLYIVSNDEIKEGDWYVANNTIFRADDVFNNGNNPNIHKYRKVIATTDMLSFTNKKHELGIVTDYLPQIPISFIEAYVKAYNNGSPITEVSLEYDCDHTQMPNKVIDIIKTRADNTVIIHQAKTYTRDEVIALCAKAWDESLAVNKYGKDRLPSDNNTREPVHFNKFIEDNLK